MTNPFLHVASKNDLYEEIFHKFVPFTLFASVSPLAHNNTVFYDAEDASYYEIEVISINSMHYFSAYKLKTFFLKLLSNLNITIIYAFLFN